MNSLRCALGWHDHRVADYRRYSQGFMLDKVCSRCGDKRTTFLPLP